MHILCGGIFRKPNPILSALTRRSHHPLVYIERYTEGVFREEWILPFTSETKARPFNYTIKRTIKDQNGTFSQFSCAYVWLNLRHNLNTQICRLVSSVPQPPATTDQYISLFLTVRQTHKATTLWTFRVQSACKMWDRDRNAAVKKLVAGFSVPKIDATKMYAIIIKSKRLIWGWLLPQPATNRWRSRAIHQSFSLGIKAQLQFCNNQTNRSFQ